MAGGKYAFLGLAIPGNTGSWQKESKVRVPTNMRTVCKTCALVLWRVFISKLESSSVWTSCWVEFKYQEWVYLLWGENQVCYHWTMLTKRWYVCRYFGEFFSANVPTVVQIRSKRHIKPGLSRLWMQSRASSVPTFSILKAAVYVMGSFLNICILDSSQYFQQGYQFWTQADADGYFTIGNVRAGLYDLYGWVPGVVGDYKYEKGPIHVEPGEIWSLHSTLVSIFKFLLAPAWLASILTYSKAFRSRSSMCYNNLELLNCLRFCEICHVLSRSDNDLLIPSQVYREIIGY